ncbi:MAG: diaminopimelate decarboxylase [Anaerovoracaceae bacterium]
MDSMKIGGVSCIELAERFGTPLYVYDEEKIISQAKDALEGFSSDMFETEVVYASKAFSSIALFRLLSSLGIGLDVVSGGELYGAVKAEADMSKVYFHGNNKGDEEIEKALEQGVGCFVIDNIMECRRLIKLAEKTGKHTGAVIRINPGISAHTHEYIMTAGPDSKFGIHIEDRELIAETSKLLRESRYVDHRGYHSHIGSQIVDVRSFEKAIDTMTDFIKEMQESLGQKTCGEEGTELSIGGGFGIKYVDEDNPVSLGQMCRAMVKYTERCIREKGVKISKLVTEPGRAMVGEAGYTIYTVGDMKKSGDRDYIFVDGGMSDNIRPALYGAEYKAVLAGRREDVQMEEGTSESEGKDSLRTYCIAGKNCESGDVLIEKAELPEVRPKDLIVICSTGAYGYSMASNYNRLGRPAVVFVKSGEARLVIKRETFEDQYTLDIG